MRSRRALNILPMLKSTTLWPIRDRALIGHHLLANSDMTSAAIRKRAAGTRRQCRFDRRQSSIIEYIHLPEDIANQTNPDGSLRLWAGNIAIHVFKTSFLKEATDHDDRLPFNRAFKKVPYIDQSGNRIEPSDPNAIKFERFIFDLLPMAENAFVVEGLASEVFAPVKNADGAASDTPTTARQAITDLHRRWLTEAGATVDPNVLVEIHPGWALDGQEVAARADASLLLSSDTYLEPEPDDHTLAIATRCDSTMEANIVQAQLSGEGIRSFVQGGNASVMLCGVGNPSKGIPVHVARRDLHRAQAVLQSSKE
ncbi:MAG: DUF2007 domain-containing protein [Pirellulaceae bacterium]